MRQILASFLSQQLKFEQLFRLSADPRLEPSEWEKVLRIFLRIPCPTCLGNNVSCYGSKWLERFIFTRANEQFTVKQTRLSLQPAQGLSCL